MRVAYIKNKWMRRGVMIIAIPIVFLFLLIFTFADFFSAIKQGFKRVCFSLKHSFYELTYDIKHLWFETHYD